MLNAYYSDIFVDYSNFLVSSELSASTVGHYKSISMVFMDYLQQRKIESVEIITMDTCNSYLKTLAGYSFKTIEQNVCGIRHFLRFLYSTGILAVDYAEKIHMPAVSKSAKIPSAWKLDELKAMLAAIDRNSPIGKRDYAMILLACVLGLRIGDIKNLRFQNFSWEDKKLSIIQHKTHPYRSDVMPIFFRILYTSGMHVSELRLAKMRDVNLEEGYIHVLEAKTIKKDLFQSIA